MADPRILETLARVPHIGALDPRVLGRVASMARIRELEAGETLFLAGQEARAFYVVRRGAVRAFRTSADGREQVMHNLRPPQSFAEAAAFDLGRYPVHTEAKETPTEVVEIPAKPFLRLLAEEPAVAGAMIGTLAQRVMGLVERIEELSLASAEARLARYLLRQPARPLSPGSRSHRIELAAAKKDLAAELGITAETLSRALRRWRDAGILETRGREVVVHDEAALEAAAGEGG